MKKTIQFTSVLFAMAILWTSCSTPAANNTAANKPANANTAAPTSTAADKAATEAELRKMMDDFAVALNKADGAALDKVYADDYMLVDQDGAMQTKASRMDAIKSGKLKWEGLTFTDLKIKTNPAGDGAVVVGQAKGKTIMDGKSEERNSMVTWVVAKMKDKGWQFVSAQITDIKGGAAKASDEKKDDDKKEAAPAGNANK